MRSVGASLLSLLLVASLSTVAAAQTATGRDVAIERVLTEVQRGLSDAQRQLAGRGLPPLESVTLTLKTTAGRTTGGKFKLFIISFGRTVSNEKTQELTLLLTPPEAAPAPVAAAPTVAEALVDALVSAVEGVQAAKNANPPLSLKQLDVELSFVLTSGGGGGLEFEIVPLSGDFAGDVKNTAVHTIHVTLKKG